MHMCSYMHTSIEHSRETASTIVRETDKGGEGGWDRLAKGATAQAKRAKSTSFLEQSCSLRLEVVPPDVATDSGLGFGV